MPLQDVRLSLMAFPQKWEPPQLAVKVLAVPVDSPMEPLAPGAPKFSGTQLPLSAVLISGLDHLPALNVLPAHVTRIPMVPPPPAPTEADALFNAFAAKYTIATGPKPNLQSVALNQFRPRHTNEP